MTYPAFKGEPSRVQMGGVPVQVWAGTPQQSVSILFFNKDTVNPIYLGYNNAIEVGGSNTVELDPQSSTNMDGSRTIYANGIAGAGPLQIIPGGSNFFQQFSSLTIPLGATSGTRIVLNGLTGTITAYNANNRVSYIIAPNGIFFYQ